MNQELGKFKNSKSEILNPKRNPKSQIPNSKQIQTTKIQNDFISKVKCQKSNLQVKSQKLMK